MAVYKTRVDRLWDREKRKRIDEQCREFEKADELLRTLVEDKRVRIEVIESEGNEVPLYMRQEVWTLDGLIERNARDLKRVKRNQRELHWAHYIGREGAVTVKRDTGKLENAAGSPGTIHSIKAGNCVLEIDGTFWNVPLEQLKEIRPEKATK